MKKPTAIAVLIAVIGIATAAAQPELEVTMRIVPAGRPVDTTAEIKLPSAASLTAQEKSKFGRERASKARAQGDAGKSDAARAGAENANGAGAGAGKGAGAGRGGGR